MKVAGFADTAQNPMHRLRLDSRSLAESRITMEALNSKDRFGGAQKSNF